MQKQIFERILGSNPSSEHPEQRAEEWNIINDAINKTKTEEVPDNIGKQKYTPLTTQTKFGTLKVTDEAPASTTSKKTGN